MCTMAIPVPVHFDGHNINIITEDSPSTMKSRSKLKVNKDKTSLPRDTSPNKNASHIEIEGQSKSKTASVNILNAKPSLNILNSNSNSNSNANSKFNNIINNKPDKKKGKKAKLAKDDSKGQSQSHGPNKKNKHKRQPKQKNQVTNIQNINRSQVNLNTISTNVNLINNNGVVSVINGVVQPPEDEKEIEMATDADYAALAEQERQSLYKTELCREWSTSGWCYYNKRCSFAHGLQELRPVFRSKKWRTKRCRNWHTTGYCPYEHRCQFLHDQSPPRRVQDYSKINTRAVVETQPRAQPLYFHYQVEAPNRGNDGEKEDTPTKDSNKSKSPGKEMNSPHAAPVPFSGGSAYAPSPNKKARALNNRMNDDHKVPDTESPAIYPNNPLNGKSIGASPKKGFQLANADDEKDAAELKKKKNAVIIKPFNPNPNPPPMQYHIPPPGVAAVPPVAAPLAGYNPLPSVPAVPMPELYNPSVDTNNQLLDYRYYHQLQQQKAANAILATCSVDEIRQILAQDPELCQRLNASQSLINVMNRQALGNSLNTSIINDALNALATPAMSTMPAPPPPSNIIQQAQAQVKQAQAQVLQAQAQLQQTQAQAALINLSNKTSASQMTQLINALNANVNAVNVNANVNANVAATPTNKKDKISLDQLMSLLPSPALASLPNALAKPKEGAEDPLGNASFVDPELLAILQRPQPIGMPLSGANSKGEDFGKTIEEKAANLSLLLNSSIPNLSGLVSLPNMMSMPQLSSAANRLSSAANKASVPISDLGVDLGALALASIGQMSPGTSALPSQPMAGMPPMQLNAFATSRFTSTDRSHLEKLLNDVNSPVFSSAPAPAAPQLPLLNMNSPAPFDVSCLYNQAQGVTGAQPNYADNYYQAVQSAQSAQPPMPFNANENFYYNY